LKVRQPRVDDRRQGHTYTSAILPPYIRRTMNIDAMVATQYLHGVSTNRMEEALRSIVGEKFESMSPAVVTRIIERWQQMYRECSERQITKRYVYVWVDGIYTKVRTTNDRPCMPVVIGGDDRGEKELLAVVDGERESDLSWTAVLTDLKRRGLSAPSLAIGDGALGFWSAVNKVFPTTKHQGCTVHALRNALDKLPKKLQDHAKSMLHDVFNAPTEDDAKKMFAAYRRTFGEKYPKAVATIERRLPMLLSYYQFPASHWKSIRSTNVIESTFATIRRRSNQTNGNASRDAALAMMFTLAKHAEKTWRKIDGFNHIANVLDGFVYADGELKMVA
jgi:transposase-like protein